VNFEERLLMELKAEVWERAARGRARSGWFTSRKIGMFAGLAAAAAAVAVVVPVVTGGSPAFAVVKNPDGSVDVRIEEFRDPDKLEEALKEIGVTSEIQYRENQDWDGPHCIREGGTEVPQTSESKGEPLPDARIDSTTRDEEWENAFRVYPKRFAKDETLVLNAYGVGSDGWQWDTAIYKGAVPECKWERVETPDAPADPEPSGSPSTSVEPDPSPSPSTVTTPTG
jgi:hypothetical protein